MILHPVIVSIVGLTIAISASECAHIQDQELHNGNSSDRFKRQASYSDGNVGQKIYHLLGDDIRTDWYGAQQRCADYGLKVASIESEEENKKLLKQLYNSRRGWQQIWTSGKDLREKGHFTWSSNGKPFTFVDWANGQQSRRYDEATDQEAFCVQILLVGENYKWEDDICEGVLKNVVCEEYRITTTTTEKVKTITQQPSIPSIVLSDTPHTWEEANAFCNSLGNGARLAPINTGNEKELLFKELQQFELWSDQEYWVAFDDEDSLRRGYCTIVLFTYSSLERNKFVERAWPCDGRKVAVCVR